jgi:hypothetical protein
MTSCSLVGTDQDVGRTSLLCLRAEDNTYKNTQKTTVQIGLKGRDRLEDLGIDGRIILKCISWIWGFRW